LRNFTPTQKINIWVVLKIIRRQAYGKYERITLGIKRGINSKIK
jgi:hypothetical protein